MHDLALIRCGLIAADELVAKVFGDGLVVEVHKAKPKPPPNPLGSKGFDALVLDVLGELQSKAGTVEQKAIAGFLSKLNVSWDKLTPAQRSKAVAGAAQKYLAVTEDLIGVVPDVLFKKGPGIVGATKTAAAKKYKIAIEPSFNLVDEWAVAHVAASQALYVTDANKVRVDAYSQTARGVVAKGLEQGLDRKQLGAMLENEVGLASAGRTNAYWQMIASVYVSRARSYSVLSGFDEAGIDAFQFEAVLDEVTTEVCRFMHGQVFRTNSALSTFANIVAATDPEQVKELQPWVQTGKNDKGEQALYFNSGGKKRLVAKIDQPGIGIADKRGTYSKALSPKQLQARGMATPPLHGHCVAIGTLVSGAFTGGLKALYAGEILKLKTAAGNDLTITPKHEVLTTRGFVAAEALRVGDELVSYRPRVGASPAVEHEHDVPARIEDVLRALQGVRESLRAGRVAFNLNGDELSFEGDVDVVGAELQLSGRHEPGCPERLADRAFKPATLGERLEGGVCTLDLDGERVFHSASSLPGGGALPLDGSRVGAQPSPLEPLRIGGAAWLDARRSQAPQHRVPNNPKLLAQAQHGELSGNVASEVLRWDSDAALRVPPRGAAVVPNQSSLNQASADGLGADTEFLADLYRRGAGLVQRDELVDIQVETFRGHVYDLQTVGGWFVANNYIITNCRSTIVPVFGSGSPHAEPKPAPDAPGAPPVPTPPKGGKGYPPGIQAKLPPAVTQYVRPAPVPADYAGCNIARVTKALARIAKSDADACEAQAAEYLKKLEKIPSAYGWNNEHVQAPMEAPPTDAGGKIKYPFADVYTPAGFKVTLGQPAQSVPLSALISKDKVASAHKAKVIDHLMKGPSGPVVVGKFEGKYYVLKGDGGVAALAASLKGETTIQAHVVDIDKKAGKKPKDPDKVLAPKTPKVAPGPVIVAAPVPVPKPSAPPPNVTLGATPTEGDDANITHEHTGAQRGSNEGGFYTGKDGVKRYVKFYPDATQAHAEHLSNQIYSDLGLGAPESVLFQHKGKTAYASKIFEGGKTLAEAGLNKERANKVLNGFGADVLTANWDAVGTGLDNAMVLPDGRVVRIDSGGTFLFRAKAGRKAEHVLNNITEWEGFASKSLNPYYAKIFDAAGIAGPDDMRERIATQLEAVLALEKKAGGWGAYVDRHVPGMKETDKKRVVEMMTERSKKLTAKLDELRKPLPPKVPAGDVRQFSDVKPRAGLTAADLPEHGLLKEVQASFTEAGKKGLKPNGELITSFKARAAAALDQLPLDTRNAIAGFTGSGYTAIREAEVAGTKSTRSDYITAAFKAVPGTRTVDGDHMTVYRGITVHGPVVAHVLDLHMEQEVWGLGHGGKLATSSATWNPVSLFGGGRDPGSGLHVVYKIKNRTGIAVETISNHPHESEMLLSRNARFRTTGLSWVQGTKNRVLLVEAEELHDDTGAMLPPGPPPKPKRVRKPKKPFGSDWAVSPAPAKPSKEPSDEE